MIGVRTYDDLRRTHKGWIEAYLGDGVKIREEEWTRSIAVGNRSFIEDVKAQLGFRAKGRDVIEGCEGYQLREGATHYKALFEAENAGIIPENTYLWNLMAE